MARSPVARARRARYQLETIESRMLLNGASTLDAFWSTSFRQETIVTVSAGANRLPVYPDASPIAVVENASASFTPSGITPSQMRHAYGVDQVLFGNVTGDGAGQTIAIIDAYDYPTALSDLQVFDAQFGLPDPPSFQRVNQAGGTASYPATNVGGWSVEEALDIEWAHAMAPAANLILVEANSPSFTNLVQGAAAWARTQPGVVAISMSFGGGEFSGETGLDANFTTPEGHGGVTFVASTGDNGQPGGYPAFSPNVLAVGGTTLAHDDTQYIGETGWSGSGGGISTQENQPSYQSGVVSQSSTRRTTPDVAMDADSSSGVAIYDSFDYPSNPWVVVGGTSLAAPMWAGLIAVADQGRSLAGLGSLDGVSQTLPQLYQSPASYFNDITLGSNGFSAGPGYDLVTGRGSPVANLLLPSLVGAGFVTGTTFQDNNSNGVQDSGEAPLAGVNVFLDLNHNGIQDVTSTLTGASSNIPLTIPNNSSAGITSTTSISGATGMISDINIKFSIAHSYDGDLIGTLIAPDGTSVTLFSRIGGSNDNFTNTTLDSQAASAITSTTAPFSGTFRPSPGTLSAFNGKSANGTWSFKVSDNATHTNQSNTGSLTAWSLTIVTAGDPSATTDSNGQYVFSGIPFGSYSVMQTTPVGYIETSPAPSGPSAAYNIAVSNAAANANFGYFPLSLTAGGENNAYYLAQAIDSTSHESYLLISAGAAPLATPTYRVLLSLLNNFTINLAEASSSVVFDFSNGGAPIPAGGITLAGPSFAGALTILGAGSTQALTMTDTQIGPTDGPTINFATLDTLDIYNATVDYNGRLSTIDNLIIDSGTIFNWS